MMYICRTGCITAAESSANRKLLKSIIGEEAFAKKQSVG